MIPLLLAVLLAGVDAEGPGTQNTTQHGLSHRLSSNATATLPLVNSSDIAAPLPAGISPWIPGVVGIGGVIVAGGASSQAVQLVLLLSECAAEDPELPFVVHPTQITVLGSNAAGALVGNILAGTVAMGILWGCAAYISSTSRPADTLRTYLLRLPLAVWMWLYQATVTCSFRLLQHSDPLKICLGALWVVASIAIPLWIVCKCWRNIPSKAAYRREEGVGSTRAFFVGKGEWVSRTSHRSTVLYRSALKPYTEEYASYVGVEFLSMFVLGAAGSYPVKTFEECGRVRAFWALVYLASGVAAAAVTPYARGRDTVTTVILNMLYACVAALRAVWLFTAEDSVAPVVKLLLLIATVIVVAKSLVDVGCEVYILRTSPQAVPGEYDSSPDTSVDIRPFLYHPSDPSPTFKSPHSLKVLSPDSSLSQKGTGVPLCLVHTLSSSSQAPSRPPRTPVMPLL